MKNPHPWLNPQTGAIRAINYEGKLSVGKALTNTRITHYLLCGSYGRAKREELLKAIERRPSKYTRYITKIRQGIYGTDIQQRFGQKITRIRFGKKTIDYSTMSADDIFNEIFS